MSLLDEIIYCVGEDGISVWDHRVKQAKAMTLSSDSTCAIDAREEFDQVLAVFAEKPVIEVKSLVNVHISGVERSKGDSKGVLLSKVHLPERLSSICLTNSKEYLIGGSITGKLYIWRLYDGSGDLIRFIPAHFKAISHLKNSFDDHFIISASQDTSISVWCLGDLISLREEDPKPFTEWNSHSLPVTQICSSSMNDRMVSASMDRTIKLWSMTKKAMLKSYKTKSSVLCACFDLSEQFIFYGCEDGFVYAQSVTDEDRVERFQAFKYPVHSIAFNSSGSMLLTGSSSGSVKSWAHDENVVNSFSFSLTKTVDVGKGIVRQIVARKRDFNAKVASIGGKRGKERVVSFPQQLGKFPLNISQLKESENSFKKTKEDDLNWDLDLLGRLNAV